MPEKYIDGIDYDFINLLGRVAFDSVIECPICGSKFELDVEKCYSCGFDDTPRNRCNAELYR